MGVVRQYIDIFIIIITFPYSTCISSFFGSSIPTFLFILKMCFHSLIPYSAKFSRRIIFAFFADYIEPRKLSSAIFQRIGAMRAIILAESANRENCFSEIFENAHPRKLCTSKIWR